jgi:hypothetical protein
MSRIKVSTLKIEKLTPRQIEEMWDLYQYGYEHVDKQTFLNDIKTKNYIFLGLNSETSKVEGFSTVHFFKTKLNKKSYNIIFSGDTIFHPKHWGSRALNKAMAIFMIKNILLSPFTPLVWNLIVSGHRTLLIMAKNCPEYYPNYKTKTPERLEKLRHHIGTLQFPNTYNSKTGIIEFEDATAVFSETLDPKYQEVLKMNEVQYFLSLNPGYRKGNELNMIANMSIKSMLITSYKTFTKLTKFKLKSLKTTLIFRRVFNESK